MRWLKKQRLWTLISVVPIAVLCGVLLYGYVIRPSLRAGRARALLHRPFGWRSDADRDAWYREAGKLNSPLLEQLSKEQRAQAEAGGATVQVNFQDLPQEIRERITGLIHSMPGLRGWQVTGGKIEYLRTDQVEARGTFQIEGGKRGQRLILGIGFGQRLYPGPPKT